MTPKLPYLTVIFNKKTSETILCLIQAVSKNYISFYPLSQLKSRDKEMFFFLTEKWWKKEPSLPITIYYQDLFSKFDYCKKYLGNNDYNIVDGFGGINLKNLSEKRIKRKIIHLD